MHNGNIPNQNVHSIGYYFYKNVILIFYFTFFKLITIL